jgi:tetratricopeptide (TPR) repeat protein
MPWSPTGVVSIRARARAYFLASLLKTRADPVAALELAKQGRMLFERIGDEAGAANCLQHVGAAHLLTGDPEKGRREITEALVRSQALGDELAVGWAYGMLGIADFVLGRYNEASSHFLETVSRFERLDGPVGACHALVDLGLTLRVDGKLSAALNAYRRALRYQREYRFTTETGDTLDGLGALAVVLNGFELAAKLRGAAVGWRETYQQEPWFPMPTDFQELADNVRRRFGDQAWLEAYEAGRKLNPEEAMRLADDAVVALEEEPSAQVGRLDHSRD